ncbi:MAG TPA: triose-phosphate isomerase [Thermoanaerobaculia bacterium]|nr:triose-phosphate isomerase [Thermoanaerobaculia bacterium]
MRLVVANWKMNKTRPEAVACRDDLAGRIGGLRETEVSIAPPFPFLADLADPRGRWSTAGQNCSSERAGAYTGEVSAAMLASCGCRYVIIGHSERRKYFGEKETTLAAKVERAREAGLVPIFCVGETLAEREAGLTEEVLRRQVEGLERDPAAASLVAAYEPVWAIGTGRNATPDQAEETIGYLRGLLGTRADLRILYGGSVTPENAANLASRKQIDGFLVGGASLDPSGFSEICRLTGSAATV